MWSESLPHFLTFFILGVNVLFYFYILNGIQLNLQAFWLQEVWLASTCHRRRVRRRLTRMAARQATAACMQGLLLLQALMPAAVSSALSSHLRPVVHNVR